MDKERSLKHLSKHNKMRPVFGVPTFCIITGASAGIGRCMSIELSKLLGKGSVMVLVARSKIGLMETKKLVLQAVSSEKDLQVYTVSHDLSKSNTNLLDNVFSHAEGVDFRHAILVNNAGSLSDITIKLSENDDVSALDSFWSLNLSSFVALTSAFIGKFRNASDVRKTVVQTSSRTSEQPTPGLSLYCAAKAARLMLFKVLAIEEPDVRVLSFGPGPVNTDMWDSLQQISVPEMRQFFSHMTASGQVRDATEPVRHLLDILQADEFVSGSHMLMPDKVIESQ